MGPGSGPGVDMTAKKFKPDIPQNIQEFQTVAGLVLGQLYKDFPIRVDSIDRGAIAKAMGIEGNSSDAKLPSGRRFVDVVAHTIAWLERQNYIDSSLIGSPAQHASLTEKGLAALNSPAATLGSSVGTALVSGTAYGFPNQVAEVVGSLLGSFTKSFTGPG